MLRALGKEGWRSKYARKVDLAGILGTAFAAGVGVWNNLRMAHERSGVPGPLGASQSHVKACTDVGLAVMRQRVQQIGKIGQILDSSSDEGYLDKMESRLEKALSNYILKDPIPDHWRLVGVEQDMGEEYGHCRPDLIAENETGLVVVDYKTKLILKAEYRQKTINEYANSHQMLHYGWAVGTNFGRPVHTYHIGIAVFEPRWTFDLLPYPVHPETLTIWEAGSRAAWSAMEKEDNLEYPPWLSDKHQDNFGQCIFYKACFVHHYDESLMAQDYIRVEQEIDGNSA